MYTDKKQENYTKIFTTVIDVENSSVKLSPQQELTTELSNSAEIVETKIEQ